MTTSILVPLAHGFEEIEAVTIIDTLRRAEFEVTVAGFTSGALRGSRGVQVVPDTLFSQLDPDAFDVIVLPGGLEGTLAMMDEPRLLEALRRFRAQGKWTAAICAAPMVLAEAGVEQGLRVTSHPSVREKLGRASVEDGRVVQDGRVLTSQGPGTALEFSLALVGLLAGEARREELAAAMVAR